MDYSEAIMLEHFLRDIAKYQLLSVGSLLLVLCFISLS